MPLVAVTASPTVGVVSLTTGRAVLAMVGRGPTGEVWSEVPTPEVKPDLAAVTSTERRAPSWAAPTTYVLAVAPVMATLSASHW